MIPAGALPGPRIEAPGHSAENLARELCRIGLREHRGIVLTEGWRYCFNYNDQCIELSDGRTIIGRSRQCDISLLDPSISRKHVFITLDEGRVLLDDLGSSNGTYINGRRLTAQSEARHGDLIHLGDAELEVEILPVSEPSDAPTEEFPALAPPGDETPRGRDVSALAPPLAEPPSPRGEEEESTEEGLGARDDSATVPVPRLDEVDFAKMARAEADSQAGPTRIIERPAEAIAAYRRRQSVFVRIAKLLRSLFKRT